jgi:hypothetical protein
MNRETWWTVDKNEAHRLVFDHVRLVEREQFDLYDRFVKLAYLYDPNDAMGVSSTSDQLGFVTENVIASNIDTVTAVVAASEVRARFMTDDGDWQTQRTARQLEFYAEALSKLYDVDAKCAVAFGQGAAVRGTGLIYVGIDSDDEICVQHVLADDVVVDEREQGNPKQLHWRELVDRDELAARYPKSADAISLAQKTGSWGMWAGYRPVGENQIVVLRSWRLPIGKSKGRETVCIDGHTILDREWEEDFFPFARIVWSPRARRWYGIGLAERIMGHQRVLNRSNWQIDRLVDQNAVPTTYVRMADAALAVKTVNRLGTIAVIKGDIPTTVTPPAVSPEVYKRQQDVKASAYEESGVSRMAASAAKPAGLDSGIALREYRDQTTQRFAQQERAYEKLKLDVVWLILHFAKKLGPKAPVVMRKTRFGARKIKWSDVDMRDVKVQIAAAASLARTPAGRTQLVLELAQAGIISQDSARRLMRHPDAERELSLYTAAVENLERCFDDIADGNVVMPEPFMHLKLAVWRGQQQYLIWRDDGAPESVLEGIRQFVVQAAHMASASEAPAPGGEMGPGAVPEADPMNGNVPMGGPPQAALAEQAMSLRAQ